MANTEQLALLLTQGVKAWNRWRDANPSIRPDLSGAELITAGDRLDDFRRANLRNADLESAKAWGASFDGADLEGANLRRSFIYDCDFDNTNLERADFTDATLESVEFNDADLTGAIFARTMLVCVDLSSAKGLAKVHHEAASTIDVDTLEYTRYCLRLLNPSRLPDVERFYREAGVPEHLIEHYRPIPIEAEAFHSAFISYSHVDKQFAQRLYRSLQRRGVRCWLDEHQVLPGDNLLDAIDKGIRMWDKFVICCSKASLTSWWVDHEIEVALAKERQLMAERGEKILVLIPLNLDGFMFGRDWLSGKRDEIRSRLAADFRGWKRNPGVYRREVARLLRALRTKDTGREPLPVPLL